MEHGASTCLAFSESFALYSHVAEGAQDTQHCDLMMSSTSTEDLLHSPPHRRCTGPWVELTWKGLAKCGCLSNRTNDYITKACPHDLN